MRYEQGHDPWQLITRLSRQKGLDHEHGEDEEGAINHALQARLGQHVKHTSNQA
jgi:hypothetical protein